MPSTYLLADTIVSPLGIGSSLHWDKLTREESGIALVNRDDIRLKNFYGACISEKLREELRAQADALGLTRLETLVAAALKKVKPNCTIPFSSKKTAFVISTTKGNIDLIHSKKDRHKVKLPYLAQTVASFVGNPNKPYVVSNACISGVSAILLADVLLKTRQYEQIVVVGADLISEFTVSGFHCLHAISPFPCTPFDEGRMGISPGEACAVLVLGTLPTQEPCPIKVAGGGASNDANHISGPSRTGDGLALAIAKAMDKAHLSAEDIGYVNTHGTATLYNDESESKALALVGMNKIESNSLKGYFGHTFGAAGVLETILTAYSMRQSHILASKGYHKHGVETEMSIVPSLMPKSIDHALKTASGFGGCNAALLLSKA